MTQGRPGALWSVWVNVLAAVHGLPRGVRRRMLRAAGIRVGRGTTISGGCFFGSRKVEVGSSVYVGPRCLFDGSAAVVVQDRCNLAYGVTLATSTHEIGSPQRRAGTRRAAPVTVGAGTWLGANATVLPGVTIGTSCVVASGALVTRDAAPNSLLRGVPARVVRQLS